MICIPKNLPMTRTQQLMLQLAASGRSAIARTRVSVPTRWLCEHEIGNSDWILHLGSGRAIHDSRLLERTGMGCIDFDVNHPSEFQMKNPETALSNSYDAVVCNYVLNVLPPLARIFTLVQLARIDAARVYVTVRSPRAKITGTPHEDGVRTSIGTFQRTFSSAEIIPVLGQFFNRVTLMYDRGEALIVRCEKGATQCER